MILHGADWQAQMTRADRRRERLGWLGAAGAVAVALTGVTALAMQADDAGRPEAEAILVNLEPPAASPPAQAVGEAAPDIPQTEAPEAPELVEDTPPPPEPLAEDTPLPEPDAPQDMPEPQPDEVALPDAPPPPPAPRPPPRPERVVREETPKPRREAAAPPPSTAQRTAPSAQQGQARQAMSAGQRQDLKRQWGNAIRARVQRRLRGGRESGTVTVRLIVTPSGQMTGLSIVGSSGSSSLDQQVVRAVQSAAGSFPSAPGGLGSETFDLPMTVN